MYQRQSDLAHLKVVSGVSDYNTAVRQAVKNLSESGLQYIDRESGHRDRVDVAVRRAVMTSVGQVAQKISLNNFQQLSLIEPRPEGGTGQAARLGWEISAHVGARPSHAAYQGRQYPQSQYYAIVEPLITDYN
jgi:hypothetical protein